MAKNTFVTLLLIVIFGCYLRFVNISPYKFYPDSYQNLVVAQNIITYKSVAGALGNDGNSYPPYFMWSRPIYPLFILLANVGIHDLEKSATLIAWLFGSLGIIGMYFLAYNIFKNTSAGLISAFLLAISFNHTVWSGYIMSDTTGILFFIIFFGLLFSNIKSKSQIADLRDLLVGVFFSIAVFARYEYVLLIVPATYLILSYPTGLVKIINILSGFILFSAIIYALLFPSLGITAKLIANQFPHFIVGLLIVIIVCIPLYFFRSTVLYIVEKFNLFDRLGKFIVILGFLFLLLTIFNLQFPVFVGLSNFIKLDFLISILGVIGVGSMILDKKQRTIGTFILILLITLEVIYFQINPLQQRYHTHLLPFLTISASFLIIKIWNHLKNVKIGLIIAVLLVGYQIYLTFWGLKNWDNGDWNNQSYEEVAAIKLNDYLKDDELLITSMPEAYFFFTNHSTRSVLAESPYLYLEDISPDKGLVIVNDLGMRDIFPEFSNYVENNLSMYKTAEYKTGINYRYKYYSKSENYPVQIYKMKVSDFKLR